MGLAPTNLMINAFGEIGESPWGPRGELLMLPDPATEVRIDFTDAYPSERFLLANLTTLDGIPWACCPRGWLARGLDALAQEFGLIVKAAFEHEFHYSGAEARLGDSYLLDALRQQGGFAQRLLPALRANGIIPDTFLPEFGPRQFEVTCQPALGLAAADDAVKLREITRAVARFHGHKATFSPIMAQGAVGNGVHVHFSLQDADGVPVCYDETAAHGIGELAGHFVEGILAEMPALVALTAPSLVSYERLKPHRWSATYNNLADKDREAGIRICPLTRLPGSDAATDFNFEYRAADAAANPYLVLGALVWAGLEGLRKRRRLRQPTTRDPDEMTEAERQALGLVHLPGSLSDALSLLAQNETMGKAMGPEFQAAYLMHKRSEIDFLEDYSPEAQITRYADAY
jgi:glutamine synthetase